MNWPAAQITDVAVPLIAAFGLSATLLFFLARLLPPTAFAAHVTARSNHAHPARQIGGLAVVPATWAVALVLAGSPISAGLIASASILFAMGVADDLKNLTALLKALLIASAAGLAVSALNHGEMQIGGMGSFIAAALSFAFLFYWINVTNFMDGLDLMVVAGIGLPVTFLSAMTFAAGGTPTIVPVLGLALGGSLFGFALFNKPPAAIFLGDGGSLVCGLLSGCVIVETAALTSLPVALLPFLYFILDATSTILTRLRDGENIFQAHSCHAYQISRRNGMSVQAVVACVAALTAVLCALSWLAAGSESMPVAWAWLAAGIAATFLLIWRFRRSAAAG